MTTHVEAFLWEAFAHVQAALLGPRHGPDEWDEWDVRHLAGDAAGVDDHGAAEDGHGGGHASGADATHITYEDLYASLVFFASIYVAGQVAARLLRMPSLVGEIFAGILLGPNLGGYVPFPISFVMLGEIGLILLVIEAGIDIDLTTLKLIGSRGLIIAIVGSILPIAAAFLLALAIGTDLTGSLAAGACFGPTSLGIAMNILRQGKVVNTPVGQLIISAAVIDDMIALIILSQLGALAGDATAAAVAVPIVSALGFLVGGGAVAVLVLPKLLDTHFFPRLPAQHHGAAGLGLLFLLLFAMMPATYYAKSSFLMGAFLSGLTFCRNHDVHVRFVSQFKRLLQWLMRIFFAASIGFQVPIKDFANGTVIGYGVLLTLALAGKLVVGFLVPNFNNTAKFRGLHLRDCLITGFSMAAEGEFAFVIAVFARDQDLISPDLYASIVLAVLISTILPPFALRFTLSYFNKMAERKVKEAEQMNARRANSVQGSAHFTPAEQEKLLRANIEANKIIFLCIQIQCASTWGLIPKIISTLSSLKHEVIDNRSWHPRGVDSTLMTEIFVQDDYFLNRSDEEAEGKTIDERLVEVHASMQAALRQPGAKIKVTRWFPGVLQDIVEEIHSKSSSINMPRAGAASVRDVLAKEATKTLEGKRNQQIAATEDKTLDQIKAEMGIPLEATPAATPPPAAAGDAGAPPAPRRRRVRQKMRSTPVVGGSLFDEPQAPVPPPPPPAGGAAGKGPGAPPPPRAFSGGPSSQSAELVVGGEVFKIRVLPETLHRLRAGYSGELLEDSHVKFSTEDVPLEHRLSGFIRNSGLQIISEEVSEHEHDTQRDGAW